MPTKIRKTKKGYRVSTPAGVKAKGTSLEKAKAQKRLLAGIEHTSWRPRKKNKIKK